MQRPTAPPVSASPPDAHRDGGRWSWHCSGSAGGVDPARKGSCCSPSLSGCRSADVKRLRGVLIQRSLQVPCLRPSAGGRDRNMKLVHGSPEGLKLTPRPDWWRVSVRAAAALRCPCVRLPCAFARHAWTSPTGTRPCGRRSCLDGAPASSAELAWRRLRSGAVMCLACWCSHSSRLLALMWFARWVLINYMGSTPVTRRRFSRLDARPINIMPSAPPQP